MADDSTPQYTGPDMVEARFVCDRVVVMDQTSAQVHLSAATSGRDNVNWAPYTPSGQISMAVNGPAGAVFAQGKRYRVLIQEVADGE